MAAILMIGAPALISQIDDSYNRETDHSVGSYIEKEDNNAFIKKTGTQPTDADMTFVFLSADDNNGTNVLVMNTISNAKYVISIAGIFLDKTMFEDGVSKIRLNLSSAVEEVRFITSVSPMNAVLFEQEEVDGISTGSYVCNLDQYTLTKVIGGSSIPQIEIVLRPDFAGSISWTSDTYLTTTIPYGEIIVGIAGAILTMCALFATPWFGLGGIRIKKRG